jgi:hypothetical protein
MSATPGVSALFSQEWQVDIVCPQVSTTKHKFGGHPLDYDDAAPPKILSFANSGSGEGLGSLNGPPQALARKPYFIRFIRAPRLKCTSLTLTLTLKILAACAPSKYHPMLCPMPVHSSLQPEQQPRCTKFLETPWKIS